MCGEAAACAGLYRGSCAPAGALYTHLGASINSKSGHRENQLHARLASPWAARIGVIRQPRYASDITLGGEF